MTKRRTAADPAAADPTAWDRSRLFLLVVAVVAAAAVLLSGFGYGIYLVTAGPSSSGDAGVDRSTAAPPAGGRDAIAAAPMLSVDVDARNPTPPAATPGLSILVPAATRVGPAGVPSGFPHSPAGAVGQLAAIETAVLQGMSIDYAAAVYQAWAWPGGPGPVGWPLTGNVQAFLGAAGLTNGLDVSATVQVRPVAAQVKGVDGPEWTVVCVLAIIEAHIDVRARMGYGYCERMQWSPAEQRWMIAPGNPPAVAPSTWPGTELAQRAGWRTWTTDDSEGVEDAVDADDADGGRQRCRRSMGR